MRRTRVDDGLRQPLFPRTMWSQYNVFMDRTNNRLEAFHKNLKDSVGTHPNIWSFFSKVATALHSNFDTVRNLSNSTPSQVRVAPQREHKNTCNSRFHFGLLWSQQLKRSYVIKHPLKLREAGQIWWFQITFEISKEWKALIWNETVVNNPLFNSAEVYFESNVWINASCLECFALNGRI